MRNKMMIMRRKRLRRRMRTLTLLQRSVSSQQAMLRGSKWGTR